LSDEPLFRSARDVDQLRPGDRVVIVGAGPAGLTAAYVLAKQSFAVTVLEADAVVGGISRTARYKGYRFDIGGHRFFTKIEPVLELWEELLSDEFISVPRMSRIHYNGTFFDYPLKPLNALRGLGLLNSMRIVGSYVRARLAPSPIEENFEQWVSNRFGRRLYEIFFKTYTEKVWGIPCTEVRAEWAAQRIQGLSLLRAVLAATPLTKRSGAIKSLIDEFRYPRLGPGQMWEAAAARVEALGGIVSLNHPVTTIACTIDASTGVRRAQAVHVNTPTGERVHPADCVISTMPLRSLVRALSPAATHKALEAAEGLRYRDFILVALILKGERLFPDNWIYVHTPGVKVGRVQNFNNWSQAMVPEAGRTCLGMEYFCFEGDGLWESSDADLIAQASRELAELGLAGDAEVVDGTVIRMPKAYPIYDAAYRGHVDAVREFIDPIPNLHTVGRNGMHKYNNQDHSMFTAMMAVWNMQGEHHDIWAVNTDFDYLEEQRVNPRRGDA
jgi:protoporphyrinogen oxidase